jgi:hypothetical protein
MRQCTSAKDIWLKLEKTYQRKKEDLEDNSSRSMKVKNLQNPLIAIFQKVMMLNISLQVKKKS